MNQAPINRREQEELSAKTNADMVPHTNLKLRDVTTLDRNLRTRIGDQLKAMYDAVLAEPVPEHLTKLLERLALQESRR